MGCSTTVSWCEGAPVSWKRGILNRAAHGSRDRVSRKTLTDFTETLNLSNDTTDAISVLPDGQLRLELAGDGGAEDQEVPP